MTATAAAASRLPLEVLYGARGVATRLASELNWLAFPVGFLLAIVVALVERTHGVFGAADRALSGIAFGAVLPVIGYLCSDAGLGRRRLGAQVANITRHGGSAALATLGILTALILLLAAAGAVLGACTTIAAHGFTDGWLRDALASAWIGLLGGATYASAFCCASTFGARGGGRKLFLGLDFLLGLGTSAAAVPWPRSHARNLVGGAPPLGWSQTASLAALLLILVITAALTLRRSRA